MPFRFLFLQLLFCFGYFVSSHSKIEKGDIAAYFSPKDHLAEQLISLIDQETRSIYVAIYTLSHRGIAEALIRAKKRGVEVEVIVDAFSVKARFPLNRMAKSGIPIFVYDPPFDAAKRKKAPLMHNKFCVFGGKSIWTGSFNFTYEATTAHRENALYFEDVETAKRYIEQFRAIKYKGSRYYEEYLALHPPKQRKEAAKR
jgi:phosphatidylserine/phosphatidylglycerophosphate/cardiolipin synthase-like enzyme